MTDTITFDSRSAFARRLYDETVTAGMTGAQRLRAAYLAAYVASRYPDDPISSNATTA